MDALEFVYWLQGAMELGQMDVMDADQVKMVKAHLALVLTNVTGCEEASGEPGEGPDQVLLRPNGSPAAKAVDELTQKRIKELLKVIPSEFTDADAKRVGRLLNTPGHFGSNGHCCIHNRRIC